MRKDLATLIGSRICHDLISPLGAIGNGVELLSLTSEIATQSPEFALINESIENANARIRFFRIAYGVASDEQLMARKEVLNILASIARGGRISYQWHIPNDQSRAEVRTAFLLLQCFETAMPLGGSIDIRKNGNYWEFDGNARRIDLDPALWDSLENPRLKVDHTPSQVQFALLPSALKTDGKTLGFTYSDESLSVRIGPKP